MSVSSISGDAYAALATAIGTCRLPPGTLINERTEAAKLGMSRTPFRQALHRLGLEGLVISVPKRGTYVTPLDADDIEQNMRVREAIELEMIHRVIIERRPVDFVAIGEILARQKALIDDGDWLEFLAADYLFHQTLLEASGNHRAIEAVQSCWLHINRVRYIQPMTKTAMRLALSQHREIATGIHSLDADHARWAIRQHLEDPLHTNLRNLESAMPHAFTVAIPPPAEARR